MNDEDKEVKHNSDIVKSFFKPGIKDYAKENKPYIELLELTKIKQMTILEQVEFIENNIEPKSQNKIFDTSISK